jgi:hypothetical protein
MVSNIADETSKDLSSTHYLMNNKKRNGTPAKLKVCHDEPSNEAQVHWLIYLEWIN